VNTATGLDDYSRHVECVAKLALKLQKPHKKTPAKIEIKFLINGRKKERGKRENLIPQPFVF
jgi:hypothetical protein